MTAAEREYVGALYDLAAKEAIQDEVLAALDTAVQVLAQNPGYVALLQNPAVKKAERLALLDASFGEGQHYVLNFLKILCEKNALRLLPACGKEYRARYYADKGIMPVTAATAVPMTDAQQKALTAKLAGLTGKTVLLENKVDASLLGGVRLSYAGTQVDGTVAHRLDALRHALMA